MRIIIKPLGYVLIFWIVAAAITYPVFKNIVKNRAPLYSPDVSCINVDNWIFTARHGGVGSWRVSRDGALQVSLAQPGRSPLDVGLTNPLNVEFGRNGRARIVVQMRSNRPSKVSLLLHRKPDGTDVIWKDSIAITPQWSLMRREVPMPACRAGDAYVSLFVGARAGTYEFRTVRVVRVGTSNSPDETK